MFISNVLFEVGNGEQDRCVVMSGMSGEQGTACNHFLPQSRLEPLVCSFFEDQLNGVHLSGSDEGLGHPSSFTQIGEARFSGKYVSALSPL